VSGRRSCLAPPADGTREREVYDRFADFLAEAPAPRDWPSLSAAKWYRLRFLAWKLGQP
jgi:hypothetical protein